jgi:glucose dehydrogenase
MVARSLLGWCACVALVGFLGCSKANNGGQNGGTQQGMMAAPNAMPPTGACTDGQEKACTGMPCADGQPPSARCASGTFGACMCKATSSGGMQASGSGSSGAAGMTMMSMGSSGAGGAHDMKGEGGAGGQAVPDDGSGKNMMTDTKNSWTAMGHDPSNQYFNPDEKTITVDNAKMLTMKWSFMVDGYPTGSPVIAEGKVFALSTAGIYAIDLETGMKIWSRTDIMGQSSLAYDSGFIYAHTTPGANLWKLSAADGKEMWGPVQTYNHGSSDGTSSPIYADGKVFVGHCTISEITMDSQDDARGGVEAFDAETGKNLWTYWTVPATGENGAMVWSTVSVDVQGGTVFAGAGNNYTMGGGNSDAIHAIDIATGMKKWVNQVRQNDVWVLLGSGAGEDTDFGANPILAEFGGKKIVADGDKGSAFWAMDRETGQTLWSRTDLSTSHTAANGGVFNGGAFDGTYFYVVANQPPNVSVLHALDPAKMGADAWPAQTFQANAWGAPSLANGVLFVPMDSQLLVMNAKTGEMLTSFETGGSIAAGAAAIAQGKVVVKSGLQYPLDATVKDNNQIICYGLP